MKFLWSLKKKYMKNNLLKSAKLNALASYSSFIVNSLLTFFVSPFLVKYLGSTSFGIWKSVQKVLTFATVADGRATQALKWVIASNESKDNVLEKQQSVGSAIKVWSYFLPLVLLIVSVLIWKLPNLINGVNPEMYSKIQTLGFILGLNLLINPLIGIPDAILVGTNNGYKSTMIKTVGIVFSNSLMILSSYLGYGIIGLAFVVLGITFFNSIFIFYICNKSISWLGVKKPNKDQVKSFFGFSFWVLIWSFIARLILSTEILLISYLIHPKEVSNYVFTAYIIQFCVSVSLLTGTAITPGLGKLIGAKNLFKSRKVTESLREIIFFITALFGCLILIINKNFVILWMGEDFFLGSHTNLIIVLIMIQLVMLRVEGQIQDLSLKIKNKVIVGGIGAVLSIWLGVFMYNFMDKQIEGLFLGVLIGRFLLNVAFKTMVNKMMKLKTKFVNFIYLGIMIIGCYFLQGMLPQFNSWLYFIPYSMLLTIALITICYFLFLSEESKHKIFLIIKSKYNKQAKNV
jgi:O-antigen/teichoic acid export membrane protein